MALSKRPSQLGLTCQTHNLHHEIIITQKKRKLQRLLCMHANIYIKIPRVNKRIKRAEYTSCEQKNQESKSRQPRKRPRSQEDQWKFGILIMGKTNTSHGLELPSSSSSCQFTCDQRSNHHCQLMEWEKIPSP